MSESIRRMFVLKGEHYFASLVGRLADMIWVRRGPDRLCRASAPWYAAALAEAGRFPNDDHGNRRGALRENALRRFKNHFENSPAL